MKSFDSRAYAINDYLEWHKAKQLELNPRFQRRPVWTEKAKGFLIDTIMRGKPIPKVFIRQKINVSTKTSIREVVDGQQRLRTILSFLADGFSVGKKQNPEYGGLLFSQLPQDMQEHILSYEISTDLLINMPDPEVLDIFSRLNAYAVILNEQEKINAEHFGPFKVLADKIGHKYYQFWLDQKILTSQNILRMAEITLVADLLIAMAEGIKSKKQIKKYYVEYENKSDLDTDELELQFDNVMEKIKDIFPEGIADTEFRRIHAFYSLFTFVYDCLYGTKKSKFGRKSLVGEEISQARNALDRIDEIFSTPDINLLSRSEQQFLADMRRATTDELVRERRLSFLRSLVG